MQTIILPKINKDFRLIVSQSFLTVLLNPLRIFKRSCSPPTMLVEGNENWWNQKHKCIILPSLYTNVFRSLYSGCLTFQHYAEKQSTENIKIFTLGWLGIVQMAEIVQREMIQTWTVNCLFFDNGIIYAVI